MVNLPNLLSNFRGEAPVKALEGLKKDDMAHEAEQLLAGTAWLPEPLRASGGEEASDETGATATAEASKPASDDDNDAPLSNEDPDVMAAE